MRGEIRLANEADAAACLEIYRFFVLETAVSFETELPSLESFQARIADTQQRMPWLVCEVEGSIAGYAYATRYRPRPAYQWSAEVTVYVAEGHRGRGVGRALYRNLFACLQRQGYVNVYAVITLPNAGSVALHEALGFRPVGVFEAVGHKLNRWHDVGWWQLSLQAPPDSPNPPQTLQAVAPRLQWQALELPDWKRSRKNRAVVPGAADGPG